MNDYNWTYFGRGFNSRRLHHLGDNIMFKWLKKEEPEPETVKNTIEYEDSLEEALWEMKENFDLETEEVEKTVFEKRQNVKYMRKTLKRDI